MAGIRDPAFWRRFSMAVHLEDDKSNPAFSHSERPELKHTDSWLDQQYKKKKHIRCMGWLITLCSITAIGGIAVLIWYLSKHGFFMNGHR